MPLRRALAHRLRELGSPLPLNMRIEGTFLRSAVARRIFTMFVLSAFVPVALLVALAYHQVSGKLQTQAQRQLAQAGSAYMHSVYERLLGARFLFDSIVRHRDGTLDAPALVGSGSFRRVEQLGAQAFELPARSGAAPWIDARQRAQLQRGEVVLLPPRGDAPGPYPWLALGADPRRAGEGVIAAELDPVYLWGSAEELTHDIAVCVSDGQGVQLYCSEATIEPLVRTLDVGNESADGRWTLARSMLFLKPRFSAPDWAFVAARPRQDVFALAGSLGPLVLTVAFLALLLVGLLSLVLIRRTLVPIEQLVAGTHHIAAERFDRPVPVRSADEFGHLAQALNAMAARLSRQIGTLRALSEIDREILSSLDLVQIAVRVRRRVSELIPDSTCALLAFPPEGGTGATLFGVDASDGTLRRRVEIEAARLDKALPEQEPLWFEPGSTPSSSTLNLPALLGHASMGCWALRLQGRDGLGGALVLSGVDRAAMTPDVAHQLRELADRVAVALAAREREEQLVYRAHHDDLTALPNRALLRESLRHAVARAATEATRLAVMFIDLDRFKAVNDVHGHAGGDLLLRRVADRLCRTVPATATVARLGGDEFVVALPGLASHQDAARLGEQLTASLSAPFDLDGATCFVGASIGVAVYPVDGGSPDELLRNADAAMYRAKGAGRSCVVFFQERMNAQARDRADLERDLRQAVARNELDVHYQPRVTMTNGRIVSVEALARWKHAQRGWVSPGVFIPLAEEVGLMDSIGAWVLERAVRQVVAWRAAGCEIERVSVNVSGRQLRDGALPKLVKGILAGAGLPATSLELEITESLLLDNVESVIGQLESLRATGITIALDDFGTGYSSLNYLRRLPVDVLKIDQSFVRDLASDASARSIARTVIAMAHALGKSVTAEGVETPAQAQLLLEWGCQEAQGYYFGRPAAPDVLPTLLAAAAPAPPPTPAQPVLRKPAAMPLIEM